MVAAGPSAAVKPQPTWLGHGSVSAHPDLAPRWERPSGVGDWRCHSQALSELALLNLRDRRSTLSWHFASSSDCSWANSPLLF